jgi:hypothetical protein
MAVVRIVAPVAIGIQILIADDIVRDILGRGRPLITVIALVCPIIESVGSADVNDVGVQRFSAAESARLSGVKGIGLTIARRLASPVADADDGVAAVFTSG